MNNPQSSYGILAWVSWPNIGPAAAGPAGPAPTALFYHSTVNSFVELVKFYFTIPGVKAFLSEKLSQNPLEKFFVCQQQRGRVIKNPNHTVL